MPTSKPQISIFVEAERKRMIRHLAALMNRSMNQTVIALIDWSHVEREIKRIQRERQEN